MTHRAPATLAAIAAFAALQAPGAALAGDETVEARIAFRNDHAGSTAPTGDVYTISAPGTYDFQVLYGLFNAGGFTNRGTFNYVAQLNLDDPAGSAAMAPRVGAGRRAPYNYHPGLDGAPGDPINFDANRGIGTVVVPWNEGQPQPSAADVFYPAFDPAVPGSGGAGDEFFPGYRFTVTVMDLSERTVTVTASGFMQAIGMFDVLSSAPPDGGPGFVEFYPFQFFGDTASSTLTLNIIPTPGAAALLVLGAGATAARRRRG